MPPSIHVGVHDTQEDLLPDQLRCRPFDALHDFRLVAARFKNLLAVQSAQGGIDILCLAAANEKGHRRFVQDEDRRLDHPDHLVIGGVHLPLHGGNVELTLLVVAVLWNLRIDVMKRGPIGHWMLEPALHYLPSLQIARFKIELDAVFGCGGDHLIANDFVRTDQLRGEGGRETRQQRQGSQAGVGERPSGVVLQSTCSSSWSGLLNACGPAGHPCRRTTVATDSGGPFILSRLTPR